MKTETSERPEDTFDFMEFWRAFQRRRHIVWIITGLFFLLAVLYCLVATRRYSATGTIELKPQSSDSLGLNASLGIADAGGGDSLSTNMEGQTQAAILQSNAFGLKLIEELHLQNSPDFKAGFNPLGSLLHLFTPSGGPVVSGMPPRYKPDPNQGLLVPFERNLKVTPTPGTRLIEVSYLSKDPQTAKAVVDQLISDAINSASGAQRGTDSNSSKFIDDQLADIRAQTERLQGQVAKMQQQAGIVSLGSTDSSGKEQAYSEILTELEQIGATLGQAQTNRILKAAAYQQISRGDPELISASTGSLTSAVSPGIASSLTTIQNLRVQMAADQATLGQLEAKFGPAYPKLEETRMRIARYEQEIHDEVARIRERAKNDYEVAIRTEQDARAAYARLKSQADAVNSSAMGFAVAKEEAESSRKLYENLLSRSKEAEIIQGLKPSNVSIVSPALLPTTPSTPPILPLLLGSILAGLTFGTGIALLIDLFDKRILSLPVIATEFGMSPLGTFPALSAIELEETSEGTGLAVHRAPRSRFAEQIRSLANSLYLARGATSPKVILITSPGNHEGKTTLSANLAVILAQQGKSVLLVDADVQHPGIHPAFRLDNSLGMANLLTSATADPRVEVRTVGIQPGLSVLTTGTVSLLPPEPFSLPRFSELFELFRQSFDCIIVDTAPILAANDTIQVASQSDAVLLVARLRQTKSQPLHDAIARLEQYVPVERLKLVINGVGSASGRLGIFNGDKK